jgi:hypothetical protein
MGTTGGEFSVGSICVKPLIVNIYVYRNRSLPTCSTLTIPFLSLVNPIHPLIFDSETILSLRRGKHNLYQSTVIQNSIVYSRENAKLVSPCIDKRNSLHA